MKRSGKKSVKKNRQESYKQTSVQESASSDFSKQTSISKQQESTASGSIKIQKQMSKQQESIASGSTRTQKQVSNINHRELTLIIRTKTYRSNWTKDVNENAYWVRIDELNRQLDNANGKNTVRDSGDEVEVDKEEAKAEMKTILKTFLIELELIYDENFSIKSWLAALHKHRRVRLLYKQRGTLDKDNHRLHQNNRLNEITPADTDFSELETPIQTMENLIMEEDVEVSAEMDKIEVIEDSEPTGMEESEPTKESEAMGVKESEPIGVEESPETEDETDKWYKFVL
ncbi:hypothetical protein RhiirC2_797343 [Rhizophagus irregularis]|uniref:Uncharacterized protein n=1 Tax=Rhizophagus irregularis TaxID=588596 RepID=A0A2N1M864_9GLOM|nr:hypothetical protein RhiirC2_797343 [Rhizophagus irregularis]